MKSHNSPTGLKEFLYGVPYYPEHWDAKIREGDPQLFGDAGFNVVRMAEFAWDLMEPEPGVYDFSLFDETIERLGAKGIKTILCTPTATPPRWLSARHPQILRVDDKGVAQQHGSRQHASHFSAEFRAYSRSITAAMAAHFKDSHLVVGWQTDNEFHCHFAEDHSAAAVEAFQLFLENKYAGDIDCLNKAWGTRFWSQSYRSFAEIQTPKRERPTYTNPSQVLDYHRFLSHGLTLFQREQVSILRQANPRWWITHNGCFASIDYRGDFVEDLDFLSYDSYPYFDYKPDTRRYSQAFNLDYTRAFSGNFVVMEQQAGPGGQGSYLHDTPEPGEMRRMAYTSIARGAEGILFFRERSCRFGAEEYWCGLIDHDNVPRRRYKEAAQMGKELKTLGPLILGSKVSFHVGIAGADFDALYAHQTLSHGLPGPRQVAESLHTFFHKKAQAVGIVHPLDDLSDLKVYFLPHLTVFPPSWIQPLKQWVAQGGTLIVGARTACKDLNNHVISETLPGLLRELTGITVDEYGKQNCPEQRPLFLKFGKERILSSLWYESLHCVDPQVKVLARWDNRHLSGTPAITVRSHGTGRTLYVASYFNEALLSSLYSQLLANGWLPDGAQTPECVETVKRIHPDGRRLTFHIHHGSEPVTLQIEGTDLLTHTPAGPMTLQPNQVAVISS